MPPFDDDPLLDGVGGALADLADVAVAADRLPPAAVTSAGARHVQIDARHARLRRERHERRMLRRQLAAAQAVLLLREHDDRSAFGRFVRQRRQLRRVGQRRLADAGQRNELGRLAVAERDRAGLVEQQRVDVAGGFDRAARHRQHVVLHQPVHAGDADRRQQAADGRRDQAHQQRDQHEHRLRRARVDRERLQRDHRDQEDDRQPGQQDVERDLVRRLLPLGAFDERDHPVEERLAGIGRDLHADPVGQHLRAAGHRRAVAARLADDRRRLAGDGAFVHRRDALDDVAVGRNHLAGRRRGRCRPCGATAPAPSRSVPSGRSRLAIVSVLALPQRVGLRLAAPFGHRLGEVGEEHGQPEPERDLELEAEIAAAGRRRPG